MITRLCILLLLVALGCDSATPTKEPDNSAEKLASKVSSTPPAPEASEADLEAVGLLHKLNLFSEMVIEVREGNVPASQVEAICKILRNTHEVEIHKMRGAVENRVFVHEDGREVVYDGDGKIVKDGYNDGSYNYHSPTKEPLLHLTVDMAPWLVLGNTRTDPTSRQERVHAYAADVFAGLVRAGQDQGKVEQPNLKQVGIAEALAIFLVAADRGDTLEMFEMVHSSEKYTEQDMIAVVKKFETGLQSLIAPLGK